MPPGTEHDFESFAQAGQRKLYRTAYLLCGNADGARDLTQTTLLDVATSSAYLDLVEAADRDPPEEMQRTVVGG